MREEKHGYAIVIAGSVADIIGATESIADAIAKARGGKAYQLMAGELVAIGEAWPDSIPTRPNPKVER